MRSPHYTAKVVVAAAIVLACLGVELAVIRVGIDDLDEGYFAEQTWRVVQGQVPFRDFETLYAPGLAYLHAALGGPNLLAMRVLALAARAALALSLFGLSRPLVRNPLWAALPAAFLLIGFDDAPEFWEPHPGWLSTLFAVWAAWTLDRSASPRAVAAAGALAGVSYAFKQNTGLLMFLAILAWTARHGTWPWAVAGFAAVSAPWAIALIAALHGEFRPLAPLIGAVNQAGLISPPEQSILVPLAALAGGAWLARAEARVRWYLVAGLALFGTQYPRMDTLHLAWSSPLLLGLGAAALDRLRPGFVIAPLVLLAVEAMPMVSSRLTFVAQAREPIGLVEAPTQTTRDLTGVIATIQARTRPDEPIFVYPSSPLLYVLADRPNPTRFDHLNPGAATPEQIQRVIADIERANTRLVVISEFWRQAWGPPGPNAPLEAYLASHFVEAAQHGAYRVLVARL